MSLKGSVESFSVTRPVRFVVDEPPALVGTPVVAMALHGYGMNCAEMLDLTRQLLGPGPIIASLEAPNAFNLGRDPRSVASGYNWGTRDTAEFHVEVHHQMVERLRQILAARYSLGAMNMLLLGYSQSVGLNYRFLASHPGAVRAGVALCGGIPTNWDQGDQGLLDTALLHIARSEDEFFPASDVSALEQRLRRRAPDVEFHVLPGRHRFPLQAARLVQSWMVRVFGGSQAAQGELHSP